MPEAITDLDKVILDAVAACKHGPVHNLLLRYTFPVRLIKHPLDGKFEDQAAAWQAAERPQNLYINHGTFIHPIRTDGTRLDGIGHIINELKQKGDSNRALYSLINMHDIVGKGDLPIPSFLILQFGKLDKTLNCTAYFRALEVGSFLPINLTEMCSVMKRIYREFPDIERIDLCIHAFRAYFKENFDCLEKSLLDQQGVAKILAWLTEPGKKDEVRDWLISKLKESTVIATSGFEEMCNFLRLSRDKTRPFYSDEFLAALEQAKACLIQLKELRLKASFGKELETTTDQFRKHLQKAISAI
jgi:hypothetical protein